MPAECRPSEMGRNPSKGVAGEAAAPENVGMGEPGLLFPSSDLAQPLRDDYMSPASRPRRTEQRALMKAVQQRGTRSESAAPYARSGESQRLHGRRPMEEPVSQQGLQSASTQSPQALVHPGATSVASQSRLGSVGTSLRGQDYPQPLPVGTALANREGDGVPPYIVFPVILTWTEGDLKLLTATKQDTPLGKVRVQSLLNSLRRHALTAKRQISSLDFFSRQESKLREVLRLLSPSLNPDPVISPPLISEIREIASQVRDYHKHSVWKAKQKWLAAADRMTASHFRRVPCNGSDTCVLQLDHPFDEASPPAVTTEAILDYAVLFCRDLFTTRLQIPNVDEYCSLHIWPALDKELSLEQRQALESDFTVDEIRVAIKQQPPGKAPGVDGLSAMLFKKCASMLDQEIVNCLMSMASGHPMPAQQLQGVVTLVHKKGAKSQIWNKRPITLTTTFYKIVSRVLANRMQSVLPGLVHPDQTGFMRGRQILDTVIAVAQGAELVNRYAAPFGILLLDFEKAWQFLFALLTKLNFGPRFFSCIRALFNGATTALLINALWSW
ncbi:hypothetical protein CBR_g12454 [Chara braunii]|uniref:Uncharacterized protein n=1 Tax=Chara braunii TaxID=69332 RepID=A0A388JSD9_CHABU|nr:hypothetical protein CBR_g12454 [Chara braunii]|eukprot:GBG60716.1 hypothetical protein CBR_g12454 [Chara braunii]